MLLIWFGKPRSYGCRSPKCQILPQRVLPVWKLKQWRCSKSCLWKIRVSGILQRAKMDKSPRCWPRERTSECLLFLSTLGILISKNHSHAALRNCPLIILQDLREFWFNSLKLLGAIVTCACWAMNNSLGSLTLYCHKKQYIK